MNLTLFDNALNSRNFAGFSHRTPQPFGHGGNF
jgi:hypothetical protein